MGEEPLMIQKKIISTIIICMMLVSISAVINPAVKAAPPFHGVKGALYIDNEIAEPDIEVRIIFEGDREFSSDTFEIEWDSELEIWINYNVGIYGPEDETGSISVFYCI